MAASALQLGVNTGQCVNPNIVEAVAAAGGVFKEVDVGREMEFVLDRSNSRMPLMPIVFPALTSAFSRWTFTFTKPRYK